MPFYLVLILGWVGVALAAALLMGRFIAAGKGELGVHRETAGVQPGAHAKARADGTNAAKLDAA